MNITVMGAVTELSNNKNSNRTENIKPLSYNATEKEKLLLTISNADIFNTDTGNKEYIRANMNETSFIYAYDNDSSNGSISAVSKDNEIKQYRPIGIKGSSGGYALTFYHDMIYAAVANYSDYHYNITIVIYEYNLDINDTIVLNGSVKFPGSINLINCNEKTLWLILEDEGIIKSYLLNNTQDINNKNWIYISDDFEGTFPSAEYINGKLCIIYDLDFDITSRTRDIYGTGFWSDGETSGVEFYYGLSLTKVHNKQWLFTVGYIEQNIYISSDGKNWEYLGSIDVELNQNEFDIKNDGNGNIYYFGGDDDYKENFYKLQIYNTTLKYPTELIDNTTLEFYFIVSDWITEKNLSSTKGPGGICWIYEGSLYTSLVDDWIFTTKYEDGRYVGEIYLDNGTVDEYYSLNFNFTHQNHELISVTLYKQLQKNPTDTPNNIIDGTWVPILILGALLILGVVFAIVIIYKKNKKRIEKKTKSPVITTDNTEKTILQNQILTEQTISYEPVKHINLTETDHIESVLEDNLINRPVNAETTAVINKNTPPVHGVNQELSTQKIGEPIIRFCTGCGSDKLVRLTTGKYKCSICNEIL